MGMVNQQEALIDFLDDLLSEEIEPEAPTVEPAPPTVAEQGEAVAAPVHAELVDPAGRTLVVPAWAYQPFQAMVFKVRDLSLAVPIQTLSGVLDWKTAEVEQQAGSMLLLGQTRHLEQTVSVVDTARFIFPEEKLAEQSMQGNTSGLSRIILIDKGKIGLACDEVFEVIDIRPEQVTWRSQQTRRKWLAGTMLKEMIVILDAETLADILAIELGLPPQD